MTLANIETKLELSQGIGHKRVKEWLSSSKLINAMLQNTIIHATTSYTCNQRIIHGHARKLLTVHVRWHVLYAMLTFINYLAR